MTEPRPWKTLDRTTLLTAAPWMTVYQEKVELPSGRVLDDFYRVVLPEFVAVVPVTTDGRFVLVNGYKHGLKRVTLSPPAGLLDAGEDPRAAAARELLEETGYEAAAWKPMGAYVVDGNRQCGRMHAYLATGARLVCRPREDDAEELQPLLLTRPELVRALTDGAFGTLAGASAVALALVHTTA